MQSTPRGDEFHPISYTVRGAVRASGLSRSRIYELLARGVLKARKDGRKTLVLADSFAEIPASDRVEIDFRQVRPERGMPHYADALAWARLVLAHESPLIENGTNLAPSLLFPMEAVFEAFVAKNLRRKLARPLSLRTQSQRHYLTRHQRQNWFRLKPDLIIHKGGRDLIVLDTKWKLLDSAQSNGTEKYGLSQADFYQLQAYGQSYLDGAGDLILIYPRTATFDQPLAIFEFPKSRGLCLWVLPFCLKTRVLLLPSDAPFADALGQRKASASQVHMVDLTVSGSTSSYGASYVNEGKG